MTSQGNGADERNQGRLLALITKMPSASTIELAGHAGFDFVLIDTEHGPNDMVELEHHVRAAETAGARALVRVASADSPDILRALDAGAEGVIIPHVNSAADVCSAVALTRYPPSGRRSLAVSTRAGHHGTRPVDQHVLASNELLVIAQLEDAEALDHLPEILDCDGLSGAFIGPADLSASLGHPGQVDHPVVSEAVERMTAAVLSRPHLWLCVLASGEEDARAWSSRGAHLLLFNAPVLLGARLAAIVQSRNDLDGIGAAEAPGVGPDAQQVG
jgi:4-hydroxy-2-oxoheptanedioate aldolase